MDNAALKLELLDWLINLNDESKIRQIVSIKDQPEQIVAYTVLGEPLTEAQYQKEIDKGIADVKAGRVKPLSEIKKKYSRNE